MTREQTVKALRRLVARCVPERLLEIYRTVRFEGDFSSWSEARAASLGYDSASILRRVARATRAVREGRAVFERDGIAFKTAPEPWAFSPLLAELGRASGDGLHVVDFGGSLGGTRDRVRPELAAAEPLVWHVIEQPLFVEAGKASFSDATLHFHATVREALANGARPDVLLISGVIGYVESPWETLDELLNAGDWKVVIVDRTLLHPTALRDRLVVQKLPLTLYRASYPAWILRRGRMLEAFDKRFRLALEANTVDPPSCGAISRGLCFVKR